MSRAVRGRFGGWQRGAEVWRSRGWLGWLCRLRVIILTFCTAHSVRDSGGWRGVWLILLRGGQLWQKFSDTLHASHSGQAEPGAGQRSYLHVTAQVNKQAAASALQQAWVVKDGTKHNHGAWYVSYFSSGSSTTVQNRTYRKLNANIYSGTQFELTPPPGDAVSAIKFAPDVNNKLLVSCWDKNVYYYEVDTSNTGRSTLLQCIEHKAPVLDACFGDDHTVAFSGGLDWAVHRYSR